MKGLIGGLILAWVAATAAQSDTNVVTYQNITLTQPLPADIAPLASQQASQSADQTLSEFERDVCRHRIGDDISSTVDVLSRGCDGPVIAVSASESFTSFLTPDQPIAPIPTGIDTMTFGETTLGDMRAQLCSEGLILLPFVGQQTLDNSLRSFSLLYELEGTSAAVLFMFRPAGFAPLFSQDQRDSVNRDDATLAMITVLTRATVDAVFEVSPDTPLTPSAGYTPIKGLFVSTSVPMNACSNS